MTGQTRVEKAAEAWKDESYIVLAKEVKHRIQYFYMNTDGVVNVPDSAAGDILALAYVLAKKIAKLEREKSPDWKKEQAA